MKLQPNLNHANKQFFLTDGFLIGLLFKKTNQ